MKRWLIGAAALLALYVAVAGYWLPRHLERVIPEYFATQLGRKATVGTVSINPLLFKAELADFALAEADGRAIVRFRRLVIDFELSSLPRWAWTFSLIGLDGLELLADIDPDGRFNLAELANAFPKGEAGKEEPDAPPPRMLLQHISITDAAILFSDRSGARPRADSVRPLALELHDLTTIPDRRGPYRLNARLPGGATLSWLGEVSLRPIFSLGEIAIRGGRPAALWKFFQDDLKIAEPAGTIDVDLRYNAAYAGGAPEFTVEDIQVTARDVALAHPGAKQPFFALKTATVAGARFDLAAREVRVPAIELRDGAVRAEIGADGVADLQKLVPGQEKPGPPGEPWRVKLDSVKLGGIALELRDLSRAAPLALSAGALDASLSAALETGAAAQVTVSDFALKVARVGAGDATAPEPVAGLGALTLEGGSLDLREQRVTARRVAVDGGLISVSREADGSLPALALLKSNLPERPAPAGKPWRYAIDAFELGGLKVALADRGFSPPVAYDIEPLSIAVRNLRSEGRQPVRLDAALPVAQGGMLKLSAEAAPAFDRASGRATLERLSLKPLQPAVASRTLLALDSGSVSAAFQGQYRARKDGAEIRASGNASVDDLLLKEAASGERFLEWKSVAASGIALGDRLAIADIVLSGLGAKVVVNKDRSVNLVQMVRPQAGEARPEPAPRPAAEPFPLAIERVRLDRATVDFADLSLVLPFAAKIEEFSGDLLGLSTDRASRAVAKLEGKVDEFGLARVDGSLATFDPKSFMDLRVQFRNVEMTPLSAYSATFAGRRIAAGRLGLDLQYRIDKGALAGDNKVELRNFTLGERVEAPGALSLPLDLAVALLTDAQGRIAIAMPVKGDVNDPQFSYGHLVWQAITTVLTNIVSAPFRALFGGGEQVEDVAFDPGRAALTPPEREKLKRLADALAQRPQLKLVVEGQHGDADAGALRARDVAAAIALKLERETKGGEPAPVNPREARTQRALEQLFVERGSEQALAELAAGRQRDGPFYDALLARLVEGAPLPADALDALARARADAVAQHLQSLAVPPARIGRKASSADGERAKLALDVAN